MVTNLLRGNITMTSFEEEEIKLTVLRAVALDGMKLEHFPSWYNDNDVVWTAIAQNPNAAKFAHYRTLKSHPPAYLDEVFEGMKLPGSGVGLRSSPHLVKK